MTANLLILERFDDGAGGVNDPDGVRAQQQQAAAYAEGYAAGEAAALSRATEQNGQLQEVASVLARKLEDFDREAAAALGEALASAAAAVLPSLAEKGFAHEAAPALAEMVAKKDNASLVLKTAEGKDAFVRKVLAEVGLEERITIEPDAALVGLQMAVEWQNGGLSFDTEQAVAHFLASLEKTISEMKNGVQHD